MNVFADLSLSRNIRISHSILKTQFPTCIIQFLFRPEVKSSMIRNSITNLVMHPYNHIYDFERDEQIARRKKLRVYLIRKARLKAFQNYFFRTPQPFQG